jgi:hypothetical protein
VSTALDVALAVVIVAGALVVLSSVGTRPPAEHGTDAADETATLLGTSTATVNYTLAPDSGRHAGEFVDFETVEGPAHRRYAHGTLAELLARAAASEAALDGTKLSTTGDDFARGVRVAVRETVAGADARVQVRATWRPYRGASLFGRVVAGETPPGDATVHAATMTVPSSVPASGARARAVADRGYRAVARTVAARTVRGLFTPEETWLALRADRPVSTLVTSEYRHAAALLGTEVEPALSRYDVAAANENLTTALAERFERDLRERFASPTAAAETVSTGVVVVTVRTWSP